MTEQLLEPKELSTEPEKSPKASRPNPKIGLAALAAVLLLAGLFWKNHSAQPVESTATTAEAPAPLLVEVASATLKPVETTVAAQGILSPGEGAASRVAVSTPGRVTQVLVREGQQVTAGQLLAIIDNRSAVAAQQSALAALSASQADARQAELATRATQSDQNNALRQAQLALKTATTESNGAVKQAEIALRSAQSDLRKVQVAVRAPDVENGLQQSRLGLKSARIDRTTAVDAARNALQAAQTDLDKLQAGARPQEIAQAQQNVNQAEATRDRAITEVDRVQFLFEKGIKARRELDDAKTALKVAESALQSTQDALSLLQAGAPRQDIVAAELRVSGAKDAITTAQQSGDAKVQQAQSALELAQGNVGQALKQRPEDVRSAILKVSAARDVLNQARQSGAAKILQARAALQAASQGGLQVAAKSEDARAKQSLVSGKQADLSAAQISAASGELRAPISGTITKRNLNLGDMADPATPLLEITDSNSLNLIANLTAENGASVRAGQMVRVRAESAPGKVFTAQVLSVGQVDPQTGLLSVRIVVSNPGNALKVGALASCDIIVARRPLAVTIPTQSIITRDGKPVVFVANGEKAKQQTVTTGVENGDLTEIRHGIRPGERVIRVGQYELEDGAAVKVKSPK